MSTHSIDAVFRASLRACPLAAAFMIAGLLTACGSAGTKPEPTAAPSPVLPDAEAVSRYQQVLGALQAGNDPAAETQLRALINDYPQHAGPMVNLALLQARRNELQPAAELLTRATTVCEQCAQPWTELGVVQRKLGRFEAAEQSYQNAIAADDRYANAHFNLAVLYDLYLQRPELALEQFQRFRELGGAATSGDVEKWIADLQRRTQQRAAQAEAGP
jgi:tetratricopeptide (TPR) repeat protein